MGRLPKHLLLCTILCVWGATRVNAQSHDDQEIAQLGAAWEQAFNARNPEAMAWLYTANCIRMPEGGPATVGRENLAEAYRAEFGPLWETDNATIDIVVASTVVAGNEAYARGTSEMHIKGASRPVRGKWFAAYRKQPDGGWLYHWSAFTN